MEKIDISTFDASKIVNIGTVNTLINNLRNIQDQLKGKLNGVTLFYRGHANKEWSLTPGVYRSEAAIKREDYLVHDLIRHCPIDLDFEAMREYFMDNGKTVRYLKGDCFSEAERDGRNRLSFIGLANSKKTT